MPWLLFSLISLRWEPLNRLCFRQLFLFILLLLSWWPYYFLIRLVRWIYLNVFIRWTIFNTFCILILCRSGWLLLLLRRPKNLLEFLIIFIHCYTVNIILHMWDIVLLIKIGISIVRSTRPHNHLIIRQSLLFPRVVSKIRLLHHAVGRSASAIASLSSFLFI